MDALLFRRIMGLWPTGVAVVTGWADDGKPLGFVVGSLCSVSLSPTLIAFCVQKESSTWAQFRKRGSFRINFLALDQSALCWRFASGNPASRFEGLDVPLSPGEQPRLPGCCAWMDVRMNAEVEAGDHWLVIAEVTAMEQGPSADPLAFAKGRLNRVEPWLDLDPNHFERWEHSLNALYVG